MPQIEVRFYCERDGKAPVLVWLDELAKQDRRAYNKCHAAITRLSEFGHELRRPTADYLEHGIYELRIRAGRVNYRLLYFFASTSVTILTHALTKERAIPSSELKRAKTRKQRFLSDPERHTYSEPIND